MTLDYVPIVDAAVVYDCPYQSKTFLLLTLNALYTPKLYINLLPPFIARESGNQIKEYSKIQTSDPSINDDSMYVPSCKLRIPFKPLNTFYYFETRKPMAKELEICDKVFITSD